jgi:hypothetical protein
VIQVEQPTPEMAAAMGLARAGRKRRRKNGRTCEDCFFHCKMLCALDLDEPCSTFRPDSADGLVPPRQPALLLRQPPADTPAGSARASGAA